MTTRFQKAIGFPKPPKREAKPPKRIKRGKGPRKASLRDLPKLRAKLWDLFAAYVKERDGNTCFTCGKEGLEGQGWHAGHMVKRTRASVCYDPANVHSQCAGCNIALDGNAAVYALRHIAKYGHAKTVALLEKARELKKWKPFEIEELIAALKLGGADFECLYEERYGVGVFRNPALVVEAARPVPGPSRRDVEGERILSASKVGEERNER